MLFLFLISLAGIPPTGGFLGKFFVFGAAIEQQMWVLAIIAAINSVIAAFYYLNVVRYMFFMPSPEDSAPIKVEAPLAGAILLAGVVTLLLGLDPRPRHKLGQRIGAKPALIPEVRSSIDGSGSGHSTHKTQTPQQTEGEPDRQAMARNAGTLLAGAGRRRLRAVHRLQPDSLRPWIRAASQASDTVAPRAHSLTDKIAAFFNDLSPAEIIGFILLFIALIAIVYRLRWRVTHSKSLTQIVMPALRR